MANIRHNLKNLLLKGKSFVSVINSSKENILNGNLDKRGWQSVSAGGSDDFAGIFLSATGITDPTITSAVYTLVNDLNGYGLWSKMKAIYPMVGGNATAHSYNLKDTTKFQITWYGGLTHDSNGVTGNGSNGFGRLNTTTISGILGSPTNFGFGSYITTNTDTNGPDIGIYDIHTFYRNSSNTYERGLSVASQNYATTDSRAFFHRYNSSGVSSAFYNSTKKLTGTGITTFGSPNDYWYLLGITGWPGYSNKRFSFNFVSEYLNDTEAANLYTSIQKFQTTLNRFVGTPIYPSFDSDAQSFMTSASITDSTQQAAINYLVTDLKSNNLWTKMKAVYPMVGGNATAHSYNLKDITKFQIAFSGGWTHASTGATPNGTNAFGNTAFIPSSNGLAYNNNHLSFYSRTSQTGATQFYEMGSGNNAGSNNLSLFIRRNTDLAGYDSGDFLTNRLTFTNTNGQGFYCGTAPTTTSKYFKNGISQASKSLSVKSISNLNTYIGAFNEDNTVVYYSNKECAFSTIGEGLSDTEASNLYTIIQNYQTILSRQV